MLIGALVGLLFAIVYCVIHRSDTWNEDRALIGICSVGIGSLLGALALLPASLFVIEDKVVRWNLVSMTDGIETQGSFFLGSGYIDGVPSFTYYQDNGDGSSSLVNVSASRATVVETDEDPYVTADCDYLSTPDWTVWPLSMGFDNSWDCGSGDVTFYVPKGSIRNDFVLDAQ